MRVPWFWFIACMSSVFTLFCSQEWDSKQEAEQEVMLWSAQGLSKVITMDYIEEESLEPRVVSCLKYTKFANVARRESYFQIDNPLIQFNTNNKSSGAQEMQSLDALRCALWKKDTGAVIDCLDLEDVPVDSVVQNGHTGLQIACQRGNAILADCFIRRNAKVNWKGRIGVHPIFFAAQSGSLTTVSLLLATQKIRMDALDVDKNTALMYAASAGHHDIVEKLVKAGANVLRKNNDKKTALDIAQKKYKQFSDKELRENASSDSEIESIDTDKKDEYARVIAFLTEAESKATKEKWEEIKDNALAHAEGFTVVRKPNMLYQTAYNGSALHEPPPYKESWGNWFRRFTREYLPDLLS